MTVTIDQVRDFLRYDDADNDQTLTILMKAGQDWVERHTGHLLTERQVTQNAVFGPVVDLLWQPYKPGTIEAKYFDQGFTEQTFTGVIVRADGRVLPTSAWPSSKSASLTYTAGYASEDAVPASMIHAVCLYCAMSDEERGDIASSAWNALRNVLGDYYRPVIA